jgi:hypothetical protein
MALGALQKVQVRKGEKRCQRKLKTGDHCYRIPPPPPPPPQTTTKTFEKGGSNS